MTDTATQQGVVDSDTSADDIDNDSNPVERPPSARELAMEEIHAKRLAEIQAETGVDEQLAAQTDDDPPRDPPPSPPATTIRVKVDGEERDVPLDEVVRNYQKGAAADKRLEEASRLLRETKEAQERLAQIARQNDEPPATPVSTARAAQDDGSPPKVGELHKKFVSSLYEGDDDATARLLDELVDAKIQSRSGEGRTTATPREEIVAEVKRQLEEDSAFEQFSTNFNDVWSDPYLANIADQYLAAEMKKGEHSSLGAALTAAGNATRDWMRAKGMKVEENKTQTADLNTRLERKANVTPLPSASVRATSTEEQPATAANTIAEMRRARGQA